MHDSAFRLPCKVHSNAAHGFAEFLIIHLPCKNTLNRRNNSFTLVWRVKEVLQSLPPFLTALTGVTVLPRRLKSYNRTQIGRSVRASRWISRMTIRYIAVTNSRKTAVEEPVPSMQQES